MNLMFSRALAQLRREKGISQRQAAQDLGVSQALLSHYENGIREPGLTFVVKVCDYYGASADYLLGRTPNRGECAPAPGSQADPAVLIRTADALSQVCTGLCHQEPELGLLFRRLSAQLAKELGRNANCASAPKEE